MKIITLNIWGGKIRNDLLKWIKDKAEEVDIFCFQEVFHNSKPPLFTNQSDNFQNIMTIFEDIKKVLPDFHAHFAPAEDKYIVYGLATFTKKEIQIKEQGDIFVFRNKNAMIKDGTTLGRNLQYTKLNDNKKIITICNFHGLYTGGGKADTDERIEQSKKIKAFLDKINGYKILCGDFNLLPNTKSVNILEENMINLIKKHKIKSTRSFHYQKENKFADYILVSPNITVKDFKVLDVVVSDHLPLYLEFN